MSTPTPNDSILRDDVIVERAPGTPVPPTVTPVVEERRGGSGLLWLLLLVALAAFGWWWFNRDTTELQTPATTVSDTAPPNVGITPPATQAAARPAATKPKPAAPVVRDRDASPLADNPTPTYPPAALRAGVEGSVSVRVEVDATGHPTSVSVVQRTGERSRELDRAVVTAVREWRFQPAMKDGKAVASAVIVPVDFRPAQ